jgi:glutathione synthase/RimK-type ligase-like ATP-grasp enzyme
MTYFVIPYKTGSTSARDLARGLGGKRVKRDNSQYRPRPGHTLINWGCSNDSIPPRLASLPMLNPPEKVTRAINKLTCLTALKAADILVPEFTDNRSVALDWVDQGLTVVCRTILTGHSGNGIVIVDENYEDRIPNAPLYTKYTKKKEEYRIHIVKGTIISCQRKARRTEVADSDVNWKVRNMDGGFIFARNEDHEYPASVLAAAKKSLQTLELDFGAIDIIYNAYQEKAYVLEVNTACGLTGTTLTDYINAFKEI